MYARDQETLSSSGRSYQGDAEPWTFVQDHRRMILGDLHAGDSMLKFFSSSHFNK